MSILSLIPLLSSLAPVIGSAFVSDSKSSLYEKALNVLSSVLNKDVAKMSPQEIELELARLTAEERIKLRELDNDFQVELIRLQKEVGKINAKNNIIDSKSENFYQYGWRPTIAWAVGLGFIWGVLILPIVRSVTAYCILLGLDPVLVEKVSLALPVFDKELLFNMVLYLLGYGAFRSYEKQKDVDRK